MSYEMLVKEAQSLTYSETISFISALLEKLKKTSADSQELKTKASCRGIAHKYANVALVPQGKKLLLWPFPESKMTLIDKNVILRYLLNDIPEQAQKSEDVINN